MQTIMNKAEQFIDWYTHTQETVLHLRPWCFKCHQKTLNVVLKPPHTSLSKANSRGKSTFFLKPVNGRL